MKIASDIEDIVDPNERNNLELHTFVAVTPEGHPFTVNMHGFDHSHAYKRLNNQTEKSLNIPANVILN